MLRKYIPIISAGFLFTQLIHAGEDPSRLIESSTTPRRKGPTIQLDYGTGCLANPLEDFMYFIPLISPARVYRETNFGNTETARITSYKTKCRKTCFGVVCEFEITGTGYLMFRYDPTSTIAKYLKNERSKKLKNVIDYIKVQGPGNGSVEVMGKILQDKKIVDEVRITFKENPKGLLCIGLYDVNPVGNKYDHSDRFNQMVVRVTTLSFKRACGTPKMEMKISSVAQADGYVGFLSGFKSTVANLIIKAPEIDEKGNQAMLDFGDALVSRKQHFTFPRAGNLMNDDGDHVLTAPENWSLVSRHAAPILGQGTMVATE